jgi:hypothetical protein
MACIKLVMADLRLPAPLHHVDLSAREAQGQPHTPFSQEHGCGNR